MDDDRRDELASLVTERASCREQCEEYVRQCQVLEREILERDERIVALEYKLESCEKNKSEAESNRVELEKTQREVEEVEQQVASLLLQTREARRDAEESSRRLESVRIARARLEERAVVLKLVLNSRPDRATNANIEAALAEEKLMMSSAKRRIAVARRTDHRARERCEAVIREAARTIAHVKFALKDQALRNEIDAANKKISDLAAARKSSPPQEEEEENEEDEREARAEAALRYSHSHRQVGLLCFFGANERRKSNRIFASLTSTHAQVPDVLAARSHRHGQFEQTILMSYL